MSCFESHDISWHAFFNAAINLPAALRASTLFFKEGDHNLIYATTPFEKGGLRGIFYIIPPSLPFSKGGIVWMLVLPLSFYFAQSGQQLAKAKFMVKYLN